MQRLGEPIPRYWAPATELVVCMLSPTHPTSESELVGLLRDAYGWSGQTIEHVVNEAQAENVIRWVAFGGWCRGGRP